MAQTQPDALTARIPARSMGLKLLLVCLLALLMSIPALFVFGLLSERTNRADQVARRLRVHQLVDVKNPTRGGLTRDPVRQFLGPVRAACLSRHRVRCG